MAASEWVRGFDSLRISDVSLVGGKNASLGEMTHHLRQAGVRVPSGFAVTTTAFRAFLAHNRIAQKISAALLKIQPGNLTSLREVGSSIRSWILEGEFESQFLAVLEKAYLELSQGDPNCSVAVRSSATAEDMAEASFAGQQESYLNCCGIEAVSQALKKVFASLYNDRAISYRLDKGVVAPDLALSAGVQRMIRSDLGSSGVAFTLDTESGFDEVVFITSAFGLGEAVVQGAVNPDEYYVYKPALRASRRSIIRRQLGSKLIKTVFCDSATSGAYVKTVATTPTEQSSFSLSDKQVEELARCALLIEKHYGRPMDIEWGRDGVDGLLYILQARPETVSSCAPKVETLQRYSIREKSRILVRGRAIGQKVGQGPVCTLKEAKQMGQFKAGDVLVTDMTDPDWEPIMKIASAIVTNRGGRTCHAAIIARELGIPAVVGCEDATEMLKSGTQVTVSCAEGDTGLVYDGILPVEVTSVELGSLPPTPVKISMNVANPELAFQFRRLPNTGVGLARVEFIIARGIGVHPRACLEYSSLSPELKARVEQCSAGYKDPVEFYTEKLAEGVATIGAAFYPKPVIVRLSDFKSNEYRGLLGGELFEPQEENPMIGFRGASRYVSESFHDSFALECAAIRRVRDEIGLTNVEVMIPFVRTVAEAGQVIEVLKRNGLERGKNGLRVIMMCEIPSNAILAENFLELFDGFSIGSNDMTQLTLALDRDSGIVASLFDERNPAVKAMLSMAIRACRKHKKYIGICGQGPSDYPDFAEWLVKEGIDSVSLNPDTVLDTWLYLARAAS
ncbi:MAG: phosphoenolpyruvate synthase [Oligoflexia bacterium]|nr:phosphoenolpyruvate synthase [Oligoflexia bacterium]